MTITKTARGQIVKAIRKGLVVSDRGAREIVDINRILLGIIEDTAEKGSLRIVEVIANQSNINTVLWSGHATLYFGETMLGILIVPAGGMKPIATCPLARAYGLPDDLVAAYEADIFVQKVSLNAELEFDIGYDILSGDNNLDSLSEIYCIAEWAACMPAAA